MGASQRQPATYGALGAKTTPRRHCRRDAILVVVVVMLAVCVILAFVFAFRKKVKPHSEEQYEHAAVATDSAECSIIGRDVLRMGGTAADATVAFSICLGLYVAQSTGVGGGNFIMYYDRDTQDYTFFDGREVAPRAATVDMYDEYPENSTRGGLAIGVPGVVSSLWDLHQRYGKLDWADLFTPSIKLAREGFVIPTALGESINGKVEIIKAEPGLRELFVKTSGCREGDVTLGTDECLVDTGDVITMPKLADTLEEIASGGRDAFYSGELANDVAADMEEHGGIINRTDLEKYSTAIKEEPLEFIIGDLKAVTANPPAGGAVLALILNILEGYGFTPESISTVDESVLTYHRMIEAFKFAFAKRSALGDEDFVNVEQFYGSRDGKTTTILLVFEEVSLTFIKVMLYKWRYVGPDGTVGVRVRLVNLCPRDEDRMRDAISVHLVSDLLSKEYADTIRAKISDDTTHTYDYYDPVYQAGEDHGTSHSSIVDADGNACAITSTLNWGLGSKVVGSRTGIIFNNEMDDFSTPGANNGFGFPPSIPNFIKPGKRPQSSMTPVILTDSEGHVTHVLGASGSKRIITAVAATIMNMVWLGMDLANAIEMPRLHDQLVPTKVYHEASFNSEIITGLAREKGHNMTETVYTANVQGIARLENNWLEAHCDTRKGASPAGY